MSIAEELQKIEALYAHGTLTREEFQRAKAKMLTARPPASVQRQNAVAQLDQEWEIEKRQYMVIGKYGSRSVPSKGNSLFSGLIFGGFGLFWTIITFLIAPGLPPAGPSGLSLGTILPYFGIFLILIGAVSGIKSYAKASQYQKAEQRYQEQRARLLAEQDDL